MTNLLPAIPEGLKVLRNAHGYNHYFTHLQMDAYGRACADAAIKADKAQRDKLLSANALATAHETIEAMQQVEPMNAVAIEYAHRLALELECVLADRNTNWDRAMNLIGEYRSAMNAIHEQHSPTHMGEPVLGAAIGEKAR